jgi:tRNA modification GTPase
MMMRLGEDDTIVARATPRGISALAIVRMSGPMAVAIAARVFGPADMEQETESHRAYVGYVRDTTERALDQVVLTVFRAPSSVTGEDVVEISCHGGELAPSLLLRVLTEAGARPARPGEFTERAFLNGKIDLAQAESVAEVIHSGSLMAHQVSIEQLRGGYSKLLSSFRDRLLEMCAHIELELDFSDEDVRFADRSESKLILEEASHYVDRLLGSYRYGSLIRNGIKMVIGGRPNAGKSTLLNALVGYERAIVSDTPGTTRDQVSAEIEFEGLRISITDTAGLRETTDAVEEKGVEFARQAIHSADVLIYLYDSREGLLESERRFLGEIECEEPTVFTVVVANKSDLVQGPEETACRTDMKNETILSMSALEATEDERILEPLLRVAVEHLCSDRELSERSEIVTLERHRVHLEKAREALMRASAALESGLSGDLPAQDLRIVMDELGAITGATTNEDVLDRIFSNFCIGK